MKRKDVLLIQKIKDYLNENLYADHSIQEICRRFVINREKLQSGFQILVQTTVHAYIVRQRINQAAIRLLETDVSIKPLPWTLAIKSNAAVIKPSKPFTILHRHLTASSVINAQEQTRKSFSLAADIFHWALCLNIRT